MNQKKIISIIAGIIAVSAISGVIYFYDVQKPSEENKSHWIVSGPFAIDKPKYKLGENVFISVHGLKPNEAGSIIIVRPDGARWDAIPFNGTLKSDFNYYFTPDTSAAKKIFKPEDLVGTWSVVFQGLTYEPLSFEIVNEYIPGGEAEIRSIPTQNKTG